VSDLVERLRAAGCVFAEEEARLLSSEARSAEQLAAMAERRISGEPLEQILGWAEFCGHRILIRPGVFVPRPRTEWLVRAAAAAGAPAPVLVDLCTGSGAVAVALAAVVRPREVHCVDVDPVAADCARDNLAGTGTVYCGDLFDPLPPRLRESVDLLTVNAPYVPRGHLRLLPAEARDHEPRAALDGGPDGLDVHRRVLRQARAWLAPGGVLAIEVSEDQAESAAALAERAGLRPNIRTSDEFETTVVLARRS
jgi:release factor glutamine methyltransferase